MRQTVKLSTVANTQPNRYKPRNGALCVKECSGWVTITTQAVAARIDTCAVAAPQMRASAPAQENSSTAMAAISRPWPAASAASPPTTVDSKPNPSIETKRMRRVPAASARQVQKAPMAAQAKSGWSSSSPSNSTALAALAARKPSDRLVSSMARVTIHKGRRCASLSLSTCSAVTSRLVEVRARRWRFLSRKVSFVEDENRIVSLPQHKMLQCSVNLETLRKKSDTLVSLSSESADHRQPWRRVAKALANRRGDTRAIEAHAFQQLHRIAMVDELIRQAQHQNRLDDTFRRQRFGHGRTGTTHDAALFHCHQIIMLGGQLFHQRHVERLDETHIGYRGVQLLARCRTRRHHRTEGQDGDAFALAL